MSQIFTIQEKEFKYKIDYYFNKMFAVASAFFSRNVIIAASDSNKKKKEDNNDNNNGKTTYVNKPKYKGGVSIYL